MARNSLKVHYIALAAGLVTLLIHLRALFCGFSPMDDHIYVQNNMFIRNLDSNLLHWAFLKAPFDFWQPMTWLSLAIDYRFWKLNPLGYHATNIVLHAVNVFLVVLITERILGRAIPPAVVRPPKSSLVTAAMLLAGLLFGIHPLRVESVTWITERKDVLNGVFSLGSILFYLQYAENGNPALPRDRYRNYLLSFILFVMSLMVKPVSVTIPVMLLVIDWYPLGRFRESGVWKILVEKIPFVIPSIILVVATLHFAAQNHILKAFDYLSPADRVIVSGNAVFEYIRLMVIPFGISPLKYITFPVPISFTIKSVFVAGVCIVMFVFRRRAWLPATWLCFLIPLIPVLGFFQNGEQAMAARYTYLPSVAPSIAAAALIATCWNDAGRKERRLFHYGTGCLMGAYLLFFAGMSVHLIRFWDTADTYWTRVVEMQPIAKTYFNRGELYSNMGRYDAAIRDYTAVIDNASGELKKYIYNVYAFRGMALLKSGFINDAVRDFSIAISTSPHAAYYYNRGLAYRQLGDDKKAAADFGVAGKETKSIDFWYNDPTFSEVAEVLERKPDDADAHSDRARIYWRARNYDKALQDINRSISVDPARYDFYGTRSRLYFETGRYDLALKDISIALQRNSTYLDGYLHRASIYYMNNKYAMALDDLDQVVRIDSRNYEGYANRGLIYYQLGEPDHAISDFNVALSIHADSASIYYNRALAYTAIGDKVRADEDFIHARKLGYPASVE